MEASDKTSDLWAPVARANLSAEVAERVIQNVLNREFEFGEKLPSERDLAARLGVARPTLREAISALSVIGLLDVRPGEGTFVVNRHADFVARAFSWTLLLDETAAREVVEARTAIEAELVRLAAKRAKPDEVAEIIQLVEAMEAAPDQTEFRDLDLEFHFAIARAGRNKALLNSLEAVQQLIRQWIVVALTREQATRTVAVAQHRAIAEAIAARDPQHAAEAMREHVLAMGRLLVESAEQAEAGG